MTEKKENILTPPIDRNTAGKIRCVGIEIEFAEVSSKQAAELIQICFGGNVEASNSSFVFSVSDTRWGDFRVELDTRFAHPERDFGDVLEDSGLPVSDEGLREVHKVDAQVREWIGKASSSVVPTEIVSPPIPWNELGDLDELIEGLRARGAKGTDDSPVYGFGVHLNPEVASESVDHVLSILRAYILLSDWLREQIQVNATRRILPHIDPFPKKYAVMILARDYAPDLETLITDYFSMNPTRNRELDMLPLFKHLAPDTLADLTTDERIKARPTLHYRLPDTRLSDPDWTISQEWNRWVVVERLASDKEKLRRLSDRYLETADNPVSAWLKEVSVWLENLASP
ncbi:amidoligase family protein [Sneathiella limimaris]|uniref:amidoligase family protein n=1 Tax=Sneathiella limimaris TaxID=1964213 RepID=UPI00146C0A83